jgi:ATP-dependent Clp protease adaptor protein ClpS
MVKEKVKPDSDSKELTSDSYELILFNDNVNEFSFVIESLIEVCTIEPIQAEQITLIVHEKGKCGVISGSMYELKPMYEKLTNKGLTVSIE